MSDLRTAAQQALEALETLVPTKGPSIYNSARDALRSALAQQDEPEGSVCARCGALAFDPLVPQQAEPVEPVAALTAQRDALLEALKGLVAWADDLRRDDPVEDLRKARAAIAKATGE